MNDQPAAPDADRSTLGVFAPVLRRWPLLVLFAVAGGVAGFFGFSLQSPVYESTTRIQVSKGYDANAGEGRMVFLEDYVATMTQIITSDVVLQEAALDLGRTKTQLAAPLPEDKTAALDRLKGALGISRVRDPNAIATTTSSVLTLRYVAGDPGDTQKILEAVNRAVQRYLDTGYSDALKKQQSDLNVSISRRVKDRDQLREKVVDFKKELSAVTTEELPLIRNRITANFDRAFTLQIEVIKYDEDLKGIADVGSSPAARQVKLRQLLGVSRTPSEASGPSGPEAAILQLNARRLELAERMGKDHPTLKEVDGQIAFYQELLGRSGGANGVDELSLYEGRLKGLKKAAEVQLLKINAQIKADEEKIRVGGDFQEKAELVRRRVDDLTVEIGREEDRQQALTALVQKAVTDARRGYDAKVLDEPRVGRKVGPNLPTWLVPGLALGLLAGIALAYLAEMADQSFRNPTEIRRRLGVPVFGHIPPIRLDQPATADVSASYEPSLVTARRPKSVEAEMYRGVRTQVLVASAAADHRLIQVTSPNPGDGKSTTAANLAVSLAQAGKRVVLLDADFRKPRIHGIFGMASPSVGLAMVLESAAELDAAIRPCDVDNLFLLPCGPRPTNPAELLAGERFAATLADLKARFDHVIIDTPPLLVVSDPLVVAQRAEAVVLVFGITRRSRQQVERARELLADTGANLIGVVVNGVDSLTGGYGYSAGSYKYGYNYEYQYTEKYADDAEDGTTRS